MGSLLRLFLVKTLIGVCVAGCKQEENCRLPECFCATFVHPLIDAAEIPQMVYFGFDDAVNIVNTPQYKRLFLSNNRTNPNGCPISMTLFVSHQYTSYADVEYFHEHGMEIASHSVNHTMIRTGSKLNKEAKQQKLNLEEKAGIPQSDIVGWRSPNLQTAGDAQPEILRKLGYQYDISLEYGRRKMDEPNAWPFTADFGWPYFCQVPPCLSVPYPGFWEFPVNSLIDYKGEYPCNYVDGCMNRPTNETEAFHYLMDNFRNSYEGNRAPFGLNMHAAWFGFPYTLEAMDKFIEEILGLPDVYIVNIKQVLDWMKSPTKIKDLDKFAPWQC